MSVQSEIDRLENIVNSDSSTDEQREAAEKAWNKLLDNQITSAWQRISDRSAEFDALIVRLTEVVDDISANRVTTAIADLDALLADVKNAANPAGGDAGGG